MCVTLFTDLPDLVVLNVLRFLSHFDAIQAFYNINNNTERILSLLIEGQCFSSMHYFRLPLFNFVCDHVLSRIGSKLTHLTLYDHQLALAYQKQILLYLTNVSSLHLINIVEITESDNYLSYFLRKQLKSLTIEFLSEHHFEAQAYVCEQFIFSKNSESLTHCHLITDHGILLKHRILLPNVSIINMTIQLRQLSDLHVLFDYLLNVKILNVKICRWTVEDIKYDYTKLPKTLSHLVEFSLQSDHALSFNQMITIFRHLIHLEKLSFLYRNYDEHGIDINQLEIALTHLKNLTELNSIINFIYFNLNPKLTFENNIHFKQRWNIHTYKNLLYKNYVAYTQPFINASYSISSDILLEDNSTDFSSITNLTLKTHTKQLSLLPIIRLLNSRFSSVTHLHIIDSFGIEDNHNDDFKLPKVYSFDASEIKLSNLFKILLLSMPNLTRLQVNLNVLIACDWKLLLANNKIKHLELKTNNLDQINPILFYFSSLEQLTVNTKKQSNQYKRKYIQVILDWFHKCFQLCTIHVKAHKLSDFLYIEHAESDKNMHVKYSNEILTLWR
ncbi:unnamed protein product [Rotaria magnacalcarata]|uniref:Uncharacterized protein n=1 Tax=Rotaria magnacalcarata TaxID=392030 RepID=A0A816PX21_9BILA|nr:unnamed protein product [Rotaria magnacalcarata]CAF1398166.1 unnamed protein product [Rotaria magnacalcarata]CAF2052657.1 unnamed protein product [Rotaria magnacalcarata]CAF2079890.1 unnamed protein product [Rotaria magnacalcarata]CAF2130074.1 unnamed protein product [Rotaria magnacalcarata]